MKRSLAGLFLSLSFCGANAAAQDEATTSTADEVWENVINSAFSSAAEEVTGGVRVEDIVEPPSEYRFAAFGKPDPFVPPIVTGRTLTGELISDLEIPIISPLQRYELDDLQLVGIYQLPSGERKAMVLAVERAKVGQSAAAGSRLTVTVRTGDPIGNRGGRVLTIGKDQLTVREFSLAPDGTREFEDKQMFLAGAADQNLSGTIIFSPGVKQPKIEEGNPLLRSATAPDADPAKPGETKDTEMPVKKPADDNKDEKPVDLIEGRLSELRNGNFGAVAGGVPEGAFRPREVPPLAPVQDLNEEYELTDPVNPAP